MADEGLPEGTVTLLFTDVERSTDLRTRIGDDAAQAILRAHEELVRERVAKAGGREVKGLGDGLMVAFSSARRALGCAIDIQRGVREHVRLHPAHDLRIRIGVNTGEVISEEGDLFGAAVNAAARIAAAATGGEILVSRVVRDLAGTMPDVAFEDRGDVPLKGFPEPWRLFEVRSREPAVTAPARTPFVGRETERAELRAMLDAALGGRGGLAVIGGEPGVGKTRLANEILAEAEHRGARVLVGHSYESSGAPPYTPFVEMLDVVARAAEPEAFRSVLGDSASDIARVMPELRRRYPDIPPPLELPPEQERRLMLASFRDFVARAAAVRPMVLLLDDLHWADEPTLLVLEHIAGSLTDVPVLCLGTYRDVELDASRPLAKTLEELLRNRLATRVSLKRMPQEDVAGLVGALSGAEPPSSLVRTIYEETEGNPFFVEEVFCHLLEEGKLFEPDGRWRSDVEIGEVEVPEGVRLVLTRRLARFDDDARRVLSAGAVIGRQFGYRLLGAVADVPDDLLLDVVDEAERARLVTSSNGSDVRLTFAHELVRQTLLGDLSLPRRQSMHLRVADAMKRVYGERVEEHAADVAHHLYQAGVAADPEETARFLALAGARALEAAAFEEAARDFANALALEGGPRGKARAALLFKAGLAHRSVGDWERALVTWQEALDLYEELGEREEGGRVAWEVARHLAWVARFAEVVQTASRGLGILGDAPSRDRGPLLAISAIAFALGGYHEAAVDMAEQGIAAARETGDEQARGYGFFAKAVVHFLFQELARVLETGRQAEPLFRRTGALWDLCQMLQFMAWAASGSGHRDQADAYRAEAEALADRLGHWPVLMQLRRLGALIRMGLEPDLDAWERHAEADLEMCRAIASPWISDSHSWLGLCDFYRGDWDGALEHFAEGERLQVGGVFTGTNQAFVMRHLAYLGRADEMLAHYSATVPDASTMAEPSPFGIATLIYAAVEGFTVLGMGERAGAWYGFVRAWTERTGGTFRYLDGQLTQTLCGIAAAGARRFEDAERHFRTALAQAEEFDRFHLPDARRFYAETLLARGAPGDAERARDLLAGAIGDYRRFGMPRHIEMCEEILARA